MKTYVYVLLDPRFVGEWRYKDCKLVNKPFYVGIGLGYRMTTHFNVSRKKYDTNFTKLNIIDSIRSDGYQPIAIKLYSELEREEAKKIEIDIIKYFGRLNEKNGLLSNLTDGGDETIYNQLGGNNPHSKKVYQYSLDGGFIKEWDCLREIGRKLNKSYNTIGDCCRGKTKTAYGFQWFYEYKGLKVDEIKVRSQIKKLKTVYEFDMHGHLINTHISLTKAATTNQILKSNLSQSIKNSTPIKKNYFSYNCELTRVKTKKTRYHKIKVNDTILFLTNPEIVKRFNVSKYYVFEVKRGRLKEPKFEVVE